MSARTEALAAILCTTPGHAILDHPAWRGAKRMTIQVAPANSIGHAQQPAEVRANGRARKAGKIMTPTTPQGWIVRFGDASIPFATFTQAKSFVKTSKKDIEDLRRGTFKAVIARAPAAGAGGGN